MSNIPKILLGVSGTNGAGKDFIGDDLQERHKFKFVSVTELLRIELRVRGVPIERKHLAALSAEWRREFGMGVLIDRAIDLYNDDGGDSKYIGLVLSSLRNTLETEHLQSLGGKQIWVDADPRVRYDRIQANAAERGREGEDSVTFEQFLADEERESDHEGDAATLNMGAIKPMSDLTIINDGTVDELQSQVDDLVARYTEA